MRPVSFSTSAGNGLSTPQTQLQSPLTQRYRRDMIGVAILAALVVIVGLTVTRSFYLSLLVYSAIYCIAALGMTLLFGFAGQISVGQAAFFGLGAYTTSVMTMQLNLPPALGLCGGTALSALFGWLVSRPLLRLTTNYLALGTLAFGVICFILFSQLRSITGGADPGIVGLKPLSIGDLVFDSPGTMYWLVSFVLCICLVLVINLAHSRVGRGLKALNVSEVAVAGLGLDVVRYKVFTFTLAAALTGLAGALFAHFQSAFNASSFSVALSIELLIMVVVGSLGTPWGALFGALFVTIVPTFLEDFDHYKHLVYGAMLAVVMIYMPDGFGHALVAAIRKLVTRLRRGS